MFERGSSIEAGSAPSAPVRGAPAAPAGARSQQPGGSERSVAFLHFGVYYLLLPIGSRTTPYIYNTIYKSIHWYLVRLTLQKCKLPSCKLQRASKQLASPNQVASDGHTYDIYSVAHIRSGAVSALPHTTSSFGPGAKDETRG